MIISLGIALVVYLPLLLVIIVDGVPKGESVSLWCAARGHSCFADAASNFMGRTGYWLVVIAALFSTLSALQANLLSASRLLQQMAEDRTLPRIFSQEHTKYKTPAVAIFVNLVVIMFLLGVVPSLGVAGSAASLVFLITYASCHVLVCFARRRSREQSEIFRVPLFPLLPIVGAVSCLSIAVFQGINEPIAGAIVFCWLVVGTILYLSLYSKRAETVDAYFQALRPELVSYRGHSPLVLVPITNPKTAPDLVSISHALAAHGAGRVLLLKVVNRSAGDTKEELEEEVRKANEVLNSAILASAACASRPAQALLSLSDSPWREISRVAKQYRCQGLVLGVNRFDASPLESLLRQLDGDVALLSAPEGWDLAQVRRVLVPVGGRSYHDPLRARVLGTLLRTGLDEVCLMRVLPPGCSPSVIKEAEKKLKIRAQDEARGIGRTLIVESEEPAHAVVECAADFDLLLLGLSRTTAGEIEFGSVVRAIASEASCATLIVGRSD
jgi:nucleotide-binding universal stress UspA family protein